MAPDLLSTIRREIDERLNDLRPLIDEHQQLLVAAGALETTEGDSDAMTDAVPPKPSTRTRAGVVKARRGSAVGAIERAAAPDVEKSKPTRAARGAAREAILAALDHGSHTIGELAVVTAMSGPNINGNLRRLLSEGAVKKTEREGKTAWALASD
jgi:hypothetical protein